MRMMFYRAIFAILMGVSACSESGGDHEHDHSILHSSSGISGRPYNKIVEELKQLETTYPDVATVVTYGQSLRGSDLTMIRIRNKGPYQRRQGVLITGTIHGNEFLNIEDRLPRWFLENQSDPGLSEFLNSGGVIWVAPILNPDGYAAGQRGNRTGKDLNRDFDLVALGKKGFTQPETTSLVSKLKDELQSEKANLSLTFDYHCCFGGVLYPWGWSRTKQLEPNEKTEHLRIGKIILKNFPGYKIGRGYDLLKYIAIGASDDFYHEYFGATAFTFEGVSRREKEKFTEHTRMWSDLLADQARKASRQGGLVPGGEIPKVAVLRSSDTGIWLGVSGSPGVSSVALCRGSDATPCHPSRSVVGFAFSYFNGDRKVFQSLSEVNVQDAESFTVELFNSKSESIGRTRIRLSRR